MVNLLFDKPQKKIKKKEIILNNELSKEEKVLIGMKWLKKVKAGINLENDIIKINR